MENTENIEKNNRKHCFANDKVIPFGNLTEKVKKVRKEIYSLNPTSECLSCKLYYSDKLNTDIDNALLYNLHIGKKFLKNFNKLLLKTISTSDISSYKYEYSTKDININNAIQLNNELRLGEGKLVGSKDKAEFLSKLKLEGSKREFSDEFGIMIEVNKDIDLSEGQLIKPAIDYYVCLLTKHNKIKGSFNCLNSNRLNPPDYLVKEVIVVKTQMPSNIKIKISSYILND